MNNIDYTQAIGCFLSYCKQKNLSTCTNDYYRYRLTALKRYLDRELPHIGPSGTRLEHLRSFISSQIDTTSIRTANHSVTTLKAFFGFLVEDGYITDDPTTKLRKARAPKRLIKAFTQEQVQSLLAVCDRGRFSGLRDYRLLLLLFDTGLRVSEAVSLSVNDIGWNEGVIRTIGKGNKERLVPFGRQVKRALSDYVRRRNQSLDTDRLFVNEFGEPMSRHAVHKAMRRYGEAAGITDVRVSPHTCRHTFGKNWILNGGDVFTLQQILGHESLEMVRQYIQMADKDLQYAHSAHSPIDRMLAEGKLNRARSGRRRLR